MLRYKKSWAAKLNCMFQCFSMFQLATMGRRNHFHIFIGFKYLEISRFCNILEKELFKTSAVSRSVVGSSLFSIKWISSLPATLSGRRGFTVFQNSLFKQDFRNISFLFFSKERHKNLFVLYNVFHFPQEEACLTQACFFLRIAWLFKASRLMWQSLWKPSSLLINFYLDKLLINDSLFFSLEKFLYDL